VGANVVVATGGDGAVAVIPWNPRKGLGQPTKVDLPLVQVKSGSDSGSVSALNSGPGGAPVVSHVAPIGDGLALAASEDLGSSSVGYLVDINKIQMVKSSQLAEEHISGLAPYGKSVLASLSLGKVILQIEPDLTISRRLPVPGNPSSITVLGNLAFVSLYSPAQLLELNLNDGSTRLLSEDPGSERPTVPILASETDVWWALGPKGKALDPLEPPKGPDRLRHIRRVLVNGKEELQQRDLKAPCNGIYSMAQYEGSPLVLCEGGGLFARVAPNGGTVLQDGGSRPFAAVVQPKTG